MSKVIAPTSAPIHDGSAAEYGPTIAILENAVRGVIYGRFLSGGNDTEIELLANGLSLGWVAPLQEAREGSNFSLVVPNGTLLESPVVIRGRTSAGEAVRDCELRLETPAALAAALRHADGEVALERGMLRGTLHDVNPDALPLSVVATVGSRIVGTFEARRPSRPLPRGELLSKIQFFIALPSDVLDGPSITISVKLAGGKIDFDGSPIVVSMSQAASFESRLADVEAIANETTASIAELRKAILSDISQQFYQIILPRVDAIVETQRVSLERQMNRLWLELAGQNAPPSAPAMLPLISRVNLTQSFTGFGWMAPGNDALGAKWLHHRAMLITEIEPQEDVLLRVTGHHMISSDALDALQLIVNGRQVPIWKSLHDASSEAWVAFGIIDRSLLRADGMVSIEFECSAEGARLFGREEAIASISVADVSLMSGLSLDSKGAEPLTDEICLFGFHGREKTESGINFRWLSTDGLVLARRPHPREKTLLRLRGPFILNSTISENFMAHIMDADAVKPMEITYDDGWQASYCFNPGNFNSPKLHLISLHAEAQRPSSQDKRLLSVALAHVDVLRVN